MDPSGTTKKRVFFDSFRQVFFSQFQAELLTNKIKKKAKEASDDIGDRLSKATEELTKTAQSQKEDFERKLDESISNMSYKADDIIAGLERKLADLKKKNAQLQK